MNKVKIIFSLLFISLILTSCSDDEQAEPAAEAGTLEFRTTVWNAENPPTWKSAIGLQNVYSCDLINIYHMIPKMEVTTSKIAEGVSPKDVSWITIYESSEVMMHTDRIFSLDIPPGEYTGIKITQRNLITWVCRLGNETMHFPSYQISASVPDDMLFVNYFGEDGLYEIDPETGLFYLYHGGERLGTFEIKPKMRTKVTSRLNITGLDWHDTDGDGKWSDGDELSNWRVPEGITTMSDFIVEYE